MFWRNLIDPMRANGRTSAAGGTLLDVVRMTYALRPDGITWPKKEDGSPSFKLEHLSKANGLVHEAAHDALSDVRATIALARLIHSTTPSCLTLPWRCTRKTAWRPSCACRHGAHGAAFSACVGHVPGRAGCLAVMWPLANTPPTRTS